MAHQSPMISIPKKTTEEPENYAAECALLQRCRQDAVRGAGSDITARDLLYKYFGQLELLELRFSEIRVNFPWRDAFTNKLITQTSIAYEKASVLFQIAVTHSAIAASQSRSDPEGLKRAFYYFRTCAGMLTYINENFLHAPSTDLSREVVKFLINIILAQATEVFFEKCTDEKKSNTLVSKIASQAAAMYTSLTEEVKDFMGKGIFDRNWVTIIQIKAKYFSSLAQYYRGLADNAASKHGDALVRFIQAESLVKEANRSASSFASMFVSNMSPNLPADAGSAIQERTKAHLVICTDKKNEAMRENDLIYNAVLPAFEGLPVIEKTVVATPIHIHDVYGAPDVQKTIGQDFFIRLVPLSVHESAMEKAEGAEGEARSALDGLGVKEGLVRYKAMEVPMEVRRWKEDIALVEDRDGSNVQRDLEGVSRDLDQESRECETMRVKYEHLWAQAPSATLTKKLRQDLKSHFTALERRRRLTSRGDIQILLGPQVEQLFTERGGSKPANLLELDVDNEGDDAQERQKIKGYVDEIEERLKRLSMISRERNEVLKDLKDKPTLFAAELEKFRPYQQRLTSTVHHQEVALQELTTLWKGLKDLAGRGAGARKWEEREKRKKDTVRRFSRARDGYMEVRDGLAKGLQFYTELTELTSSLRHIIGGETRDREEAVGCHVTSASTGRKPPLPPPPHSRSTLDGAFSSMNLRDPPSSPPQQQQQQSSQPQPWQSNNSLGLLPARIIGTVYVFSPPLPPSMQQQPQQRQQPQQHPSSFFPPPPPSRPPTHSSSYSSSASAPVDPYATLGLFNPVHPSSAPPQHPLLHPST
ncbi:BRO1-like domain-containing protein [Flammula alnicola]|nr:BRO1-like domain-containing protein [Flammula alnicola]